MSTLNLTILRGNMGRRAELKETGSGSKVANFSLATSRSWKSPGSEEWQEETTWHNCVAFGRLAERIARDGDKGAPVVLHGRIQKRKYTGKDGTEKEAVEVVADYLDVFGKLERLDATEKVEALLGTVTAAVTPTRPIDEEEFPF